ncbi:MAG TPA: nucleotidyltransferase family protein [Anaerolineales bacterium]
MISAIILAAGQSKRMGQPKMLLPWGKSTVIEHVITTFLHAGIEDVIVVTGGVREQVENAISQYHVRKIHNNDHAAGEMLSSIHCALRAMPEQAQAALIGLGDQPQVQEKNVRLICEEYRRSKSSLIVPSFQMRRGHPWLVTRPLWGEILELKQPESLRDFLNRHADEIHYVNVDTPSVLADLDTLEDYHKSHLKG